VQGAWDTIFQAAFVYQLQPLHPFAPCLVLSFQPPLDGEANMSHFKTLEDVKTVCRHAQFAIACTAADGDPEYDHEHLAGWKIRVRNYEDQVIRETWKIQMLSDPLHLLKRARDRIVNDKCPWSWVLTPPAGS
jgi:hypothetical protein